jgi:hypothetical protein
MSVETAKKLINDVLLDFTEFLDEKDTIHKKQIKEAMLQIVTLYGNIYRTLEI